VDFCHAGRFTAAGVHFVRRRFNERLSFGEGDTRVFTVDIRDLTIGRSRAEQCDGWQHDGEKNGYLRKRCDSVSGVHDAIHCCLGLPRAQADR
jgi:hypothetical protein